MDKIICFGKNYDQHMAEMGDKYVEKPVIFIKPASVLKTCKWGDLIDLQLINEDTHYECELVIRINKGGYNLSYTDASKMIDGVTVGLDMTLRNLQSNLKTQGHPWTVSKVFPDSCVIGEFIPTNNLDFLNLDFSFSLNNELKQSSKGVHMRMHPFDLIVYASSFFPLCAGDILFTGTPKGVGKVCANSQGQLSIGDLSYYVKWL